MSIPRKPIIRIAGLAIAMLAVLFVASAGQADASSRQTATNPCPSFSIQDVFDDPTSDWDRDRVNNKDELLNGLKPCVYDTDAFCGTGGNSLCRYGAYGVGTHVPKTLCHSNRWTWAEVNAAPSADWDGDGISNRTEARNGLNPCRHSCVRVTRTDVNLNPNASWDNDGVSNAQELRQGTNPCNGYDFNPCPNWQTLHVSYMPGKDWDGDRISNAEELRHGFNPCVADVIYGPLPTAKKPLPTTSTTVSPIVSADRRSAVCPVSHPYFHRGQCYTDPVVPRR